MEAAFYSGGAFGYGVVRDEEVGVGCELGEAVTFSVGVSAEDDALAGDLHAPGQGGKGAMRDADGVEGHIGVAQDEDGHGGGRDIVRLQLVGSLGIGLGHIAR